MVIVKSEVVEEEGEKSIRKKWEFDANQLNEFYKLGYNFENEKRKWFSFS